MFRQFAFLLLLLAFASPGSAADGCQLQRLLSVVSKADDRGHLFIPATLNERDTHLMIDTGGAWSVVTENFAKSLGVPIRRMPPGSVSFYDAAGGRLAHYVRVPTMKLGGVQLRRGTDFLVVDRGEVPELGGIDGTLGLNFFANLDLELDNANKTVSLFAQRDCRQAGAHWAAESAEFPFRLVHGIPVARMTLDGEEIDAVIDTGSSSTLIDLDFVRRRFGLTPSSPGVTKLGEAKFPGGDTRAFYGYTFASLSVSGIRYENVPVEFVDLEGGPGKLILGMHELRLLHLYFAFKEKVVYVTAADAK